MEKFVLSSEARDVSVKTRNIRMSKRVPAVVYGHGVAPKAITVDNSEFLKVFRKAGGTHLIELTLDGKKHGWPAQHWPDRPGVVRRRPDAVPL